MEKNLRKIALLATGFLLISLCLFLSRTSILKATGSFLVVQNELKKSDVIIVLGGGIDRVDEAVDLYKKGLAGHLIMSGKAFDENARLAEAMKRHAVRLGVPQKNIILEPESKSTFQHPIFIKPIMRAFEFQSAIVVSSPYHMRRTAMLFDREFKDSGIDLIYHPVQESRFQAENWWTNPSSRRLVALEYMKLAGNVWGTRVSEFLQELLKKR